MLKLLKRYGACFIAPAACPLILLFLYYRGGYYPFGQKSIAYLDMYQQYVPLLYNLRSIFEDFSALWYNPSMGGGMNFFGVFCYYLNPDSLLSLLFPQDKLAFFPNVLLLIKISIAALSASLCLKYFFKDLNGVMAAALGVVYGFCGYTMQVYQIIAWLSGLILFPLVLISLSRLIDCKEYGMFVALIAVAFLTNFYIALFIVGYGLFISFLYIRFLAEDKKGAASRLLVCALAALLLSCAVLLPCYFSIKSSVRESGIFSNVLYGNPYEDDFLLGPIWTKLAYLITSGIFLPAAAAFLFNYKKAPRDRFLLWGMLISLLPVLFEPVNVIWHLGSYAGFPLRLGFIPCFMALLLCAAQLEGEGAKGKGYLSIAPMLLAVAAICVFYLSGLDEQKQEVAKSSLWLEMGEEAFFSLLLLSALCGAAYLIPAICSKLKLTSVNLAGALMLLIALFEGAANFSMFVTSKHSSSDAFTQRLALKEELYKLEGGKFFRVKDYSLFDRHNLPSIASNSFNHYTSLTNKYAAQGLYELGYIKSWFWICSAGGTAFSDSLLSHRFVVNNERLEKSYLAYVSERGKYEIYENPYCLDMGIIASGGPFSPESAQNPFELQESLYEYFTGQRLFNYYDYTLQNLEYSGDWLTRMGKDAYIMYSVNVDEAQILYLDIRAYKYYCFDVYIGGKRVYYSYPQSELNGILELGLFEGQTVEVKVAVKDDAYMESISLAGLPISKLEALGELDTAGSFEYGGGCYRISAYSEQGGTLFLSIPYGDGFSCTVNGKKAAVRETCGFISIGLERGQNNIVLTYRVKGLGAGLALSLLGVILLTLYALYDKGKLNLNRQKAENALYIAYIAIVALAALLMFAFPLTVFFIRLF
jgi:uncharacterized membrane protein YfhO